MPLRQRFFSIDVFRAVTMLLMLFVNDVSSVHHIPEWIDHAAADDDRLGFADTIFPVFLFIVGLSLPIAIHQRGKNRDSTVPVLWYIIGRSAALIIMGFYHVNLESYNNEALLPRAVWAILTTVAFFLIWLDYPGSMQKAAKNTLRITGVMILIMMAILYKGGDAENPHGMESSWWGILGIIGWAYFVCSSLFVLSYGRLTFLGIAFLVLLLINTATHTGLMHFQISMVGDASAASLIMAGSIVSLLYTGWNATGRKKMLWLTLLIAGILFITSGLIIRPYTGGISKIHATPAWVLICTGISVLTFQLFIWLADIKQKQSWFTAIQAGGTNTLTCYLLPYLVYALFELTHFGYPAYFNSGIPGIIRSLALSFFIIAIAGQLAKKRIRLKV